MEKAGSFDVDKVREALESGVTFEGPGGTITMPGYNSVTAPNGMYATNRLVAAAVPSLPPTTNAMNGSLATITDMLQTLAYFIGQLAWAGSAKLTPARAIPPRPRKRNGPPTIKPKWKTGW